MFTIYSWDARRPTSRCEMCGMTEQQLAKTARVGCAQCYQAFERLLTPYIRQIHGQAEYVGETPANYTPPVADQLRKYRYELQKAIEVQNFEDAAKLRDLIKELEVKE